MRRSVAVKPFRHRTDYLNACAEPATGASIAFTTLVMRKLPEARKGKADAERAYPEWVPMARALSRP